jgi:hypothetical protein
VFQVVNRCFQILQSGAEDKWRSESDLVIAPGVGGIDWNGFGRGAQLIEAGESAALAALSEIQKWFLPAEAQTRSRLEFPFCAGARETAPSSAAPRSLMTPHKQPRAA